SQANKNQPQHRTTHAALRTLTAPTRGTTKTWTFVTPDPHQNAPKSRRTAAGKATAREEQRRIWTFWKDDK
ncbi:MAG: hypothetical protein IJ344_00235, partial [Clostridia bacterium]|nr:hypothetical protein [Clostridia bacterium]